MLTVLKPGMLTSVQDQGRFGFQKFGVPAAGAMDQDSLALANLLAGNDPGEACLEITALGPSLRFETPAVFALTGGDFGPALNGAPIENCRAYSAPKGATLTLGAAKSGFRCYLAVNGGFALPAVMGSRSTYLKGGFGGLEGRALKAGDCLPLNGPQFWLPNMENRLLNPPPLPQKEQTLRVVAGPQDDCFSARGMETLLSSVYTISPNSDRMGYRLEGPAIQRAEGFDGNILSDGMAMGCIQVPDGQPLVMMADRQTAGGYGKIAAVISCDLPLLAQCRPGDTLRFSLVSMEEAQRLLCQRHRRLKALDDEANRPQGLWD